MTEERYIDFMRAAMKEASKALEFDEVPVGAVVVFENRIIGRGYNQTETLHDPTAHAEMVALSAAYNHFGDWRLENCYLFSTLEPCSMCAGAASLSRIKKIIYGAPDQKFGACGSIFDIPNESKLNHKIEVVSGILADEISEMMKLFFKCVRAKKHSIS